MYKVVLMNGEGEQGKWILRQTHKRKGISHCGKYQFYVNEMIPDPDFVIIRGKSIKHKKTFHIAPENVILSTSEPYSILSYPREYRKQFGLVCSCQENINHEHIIYTPAILPWYIGATFNEGVGICRLDYDDFKAMSTPAKTKLISVITSNKAFTQGHQDRINFVEKLKGYYGDKLDVFGRGYNDFDDKWDVLAPYKYHIAIENSVSNYYWTEKLSDCFLAETFPIYYGCKNINDYFPPEACQAIDIHNFESCIKTIDNIIEKDVFSERSSFLHTSKKLVLEDYNMFNYLATCLDTLNPALPKGEIVIHPAKSMRDWHNIYLYMIERNIFKLKKYVYSLFKTKSILYK